MSVVLVATVAFTFVPAPPLACRCALRLPSPVAAVASPRDARDYRGGSPPSKEALVAKGLAGAFLLRIAATSQLAAVGAALGLATVIVAPVAAVESLLVAAVLCFCGIANYWPMNFFAHVAGVGGLGGCVYGVCVWWDKLQSPGRRRRQRAQKRAKRQVEDTIPDDGSGGLVALTVGALTAAVIGALP